MFKVRKGKVLSVKRNPLYGHKTEYLIDLNPEGGDPVFIFEKLASTVDCRARVGDIVAFRRRGIFSRYHYVGIFNGAQDE